MSTPDASPERPDTAKIKTEKGEAFASREINGSALVFINGNLEAVKFLPQPLFHRSPQPAMPRMI